MRRIQQWEQGAVMGAGGERRFPCQDQAGVQGPPCSRQVSPVGHLNPPC